MRMDMKNGLGARWFGLKVVLLVCFVSFLFSACRQESRVGLQKIFGFAQGTYYAVSYYADPEVLPVDSLQPRIDSLLKSFDLCASLWNDSSEICRVNRGEDLRLSPLFCDLFAKSEQISALTGGVFDVTVGPLVRAYGFTPGGGPERLPSDEELVELMDRVGWKKARIEDSRLIKDHPLLQLDFNAIAQGYSTDMLSEFLESIGLSSYLVDIGGEIRSKGTKENGQPWVVGIERPSPDSLSDRVVYERIVLNDHSLVTSGSYRKYFEAGGQRYAHTINPLSGRPVQHNLLSATIYCKECWEADALATACMVWGLEKSREFLAQHPVYEAYLIYAVPVEGTDSLALETWETPGFTALKVD